MRNKEYAQTIYTVYIVIYIYIHQQKCNVTLIFRRDLVTSHIAMCPSASLRSVCPPWPALDVRHQWTQIILYRRLYIVFIDSSFSKKKTFFWGICGGQVAFQEVSWCLDHDWHPYGAISLGCFTDLDSMAMKNQWVHWPLESPGHPWQIRMEQRQQMKPAASKCQNTEFRMLVMTVMTPIIATRKIQLYDAVRLYAERVPYFKTSRNMSSFAPKVRSVHSSLLWIFAALQDYSQTNQKGDPGSQTSSKRT